MLVGKVTIFTYFLGRFLYLQTKTYMIYSFTKKSTNKVNCNAKGKGFLTMSSVHKIDLRPEVFDALSKQCIDIFKNKSTNDVFKIMTKMMDNPDVPMHYPYHHFILPASLLTSAAMVNKLSQDELEKMLIIACQRAKQVPGGFCGNCGSCGAGVGAGIFMSVYTDTSPMSEQTWQWCNEITAQCLQKISSVPGPRCCKRTCFLSAQAAVPYIQNRLNITLPITQKIVCKYAHKNPTCKKNLCPFYQEGELI